MKQEDKQLLLQDLCARLPYGVICQMEDKLIINDSPFYNYILSEKHIDLFRNHKNFYIKPYLRPMSSMTDGEEREYNKALTLLGVFMFEQEELFKPIQLYKNIPFELYEFFNSRHFDYRGLIPKGLAISTEEFNPYKD